MTQSFPWYKSYPAGVPHEINPDRYPSIPAVLDDIAARYPDKVGYTNMDCGLTYSRTAALTKELAAYLQSLGLKPGDRVAIMMPNLLQYVIAMYACLRAGYIVVNINPRRRRSSSSRTSPRHSRTPCPARSASTSSRPLSATSSRSSSARSSTSSCAR